MFSFFTSFLKKIIYHALPPKTYIKFLYVFFFLNYYSGVFRLDKRYKYHYFVKSLIKPGDIILDIGANVGYYSKLFSNWTGSGGAVYAVEPVGIFSEHIDLLSMKCNNIFVLPFALGSDNKDIIMGVEGDYGWLPAGYLSVHDNVGNPNLKYQFHAHMKRGSQAFSNFTKIDYIKIDVEGHEMIILEDLKDIIKKHKPILQLEIWNPSEFFNFLLGLPGYLPYQISSNGVLSVINFNSFDPSNDLICIYRNKTI